jgi:hypothetical protein
MSDDTDLEGRPVYRPRAKYATPATTLEREIMDPCIAKSEQEWWAMKEIERLRAALNAVSVPYDIRAAKAEIERLREALRLAKDDLHIAISHIDRELEDKP